MRGSSIQDSPTSQVLDSGSKMTWGSPAWTVASTQVYQLGDLQLEVSGPKSRGTERRGQERGQFLNFPSFGLLSSLGGGAQGALSPKPLRHSEERGLPGGARDGAAAPLWPVLALGALQSQRCPGQGQALGEPPLLRTSVAPS